MQDVVKKSGYYFVGILFVVAVFVWCAVYAETREGLMVAFLDVGQGDAIFVESSNGNQVLIDGGPNRAVLRELSKIMPFYDRSIDVVIETHPDSDHIAGLVDVLERYDIGLIMESGVESDSAIYKELEKIMEEKNIQKVLARRGMKINMGSGAYVDILFPDREVSGLDTNDASVIARIAYGNNSFLLTGDTSKKMENYLVFLEETGLKSDVLKLAHHGSKNSTSEQFLGYVNPQYTIASVGEDNKYNHPHQQIVDLLDRFKIQLLRTDDKGTIKIKSDGENLQFAN